MKITPLGRNIPGIISNKALQSLRLTKRDVLLDVGTGDGNKAIICARKCHLVIGIDINLKKLKLAKENARRKKIRNIIFVYGSFEKPCAKLDLSTYGITKILALYSLHHLQDELKWKSLKGLVRLLHKPGRMVIGDIIFFDEPQKYQKEFDKVHYDGGITDFPSSSNFLIDCLKRLNGKVNVVQVHPLAGLVIADFLR
ncbi:MAG: class I SAM-dependent methyltransferase [candidate division WOR-3 bacterium]